MLHEVKEKLIELLQPVLDWCTALGEWGIFSLAFAESSFFPIPPDFLYIPMILNGHPHPYFLALVTSIGSVLGAIFGYYLGKYAGRGFINKLFGAKADPLITKAEKFFEKYGSVAVLLAAFTPLPFKVFTVTGGLANMPLIPFILYSIIGRAGRFFAVTYLLVNFGEVIMENFFKLSLGIVPIITIFFIFQALNKKSTS